MLSRGILKELSVSASCSLIGWKQLLFYAGFECIASAASTVSKQLGYKHSILILHAFSSRSGVSACL